MSSLIDPTNKILFHLDSLQKFLQGETVYPISVEVDLCDYCNLKCSWCRFAYCHKQNIMSLDLAKKILQELADVGVKSVVYSGGGEPLLNPRFSEIADFGFELGLDQGVYTNGTNIHKYVEPLNQKMKFVYVSVDAATAEIYRKIKGVDCFDQVLENIYLLCRHRDKAAIGLGFLVSPENADEILLAYYDFLNRFPIDYIQYRPAVTEQMNKIYSSPVRDAMQFLKGLESPRLAVAWYKFNDALREDGGRNYSKCLGHNFLGGISADGTVWLCLNHRYHEGFDIGNLSTETFKEIWNGQKRKDAIKRICLSDCPKLCRPHELNKFLDYVTKGHPHKNFL